MNAVSLWKRLGTTGIPLVVLPRIILAYTFISMGIHKIADPVAFLKLLRLYEMLPEEPAIYMNSIAVVLPWLEIVCGLALLFGVGLRGAALTVLGMLVVFSGAIFLRAMAVYGEGDIAFTQIVFDCGCGGGPQVIYKKLLANTGLIALSAVALWSRPCPLWARVQR